MTWPLTMTSTSVEHTRDLAARLAATCRAGDVILLVGDLGAGKTAFAQGFAAGLGVAGPVTSPTFALVRQYRCGEDAAMGTLIHADVYRTESLTEVIDLALGELVEDDAVAVIEWGERAAPALGDSALVVSLSGEGDTRTLRLEGRGDWLTRADVVADAWSGAAAPTHP
jgi:tRNA threonylcarbamoyladenosine biosynthesis protein TsaE